MNPIEIKQGFTFRFTHGAEFVVLFVTDDGYFALCQTTDAKDNVYMETQIYAVESIAAWIADGIIDKVGAKKIEPTITYTYK